MQYIRTLQLSVACSRSCWVREGMDNDRRCDSRSERCSICKGVSRVSRDPDLYLDRGRGHDLCRGVVEGDGARLDRC